MDEKSMIDYSYNNDSGDAQVFVYHLFSGVEVAYICVHMSDFEFSMFKQNECNHCVSIHYCQEGRIEQQVNNEFFYLMPGDCLFMMNQNKQQKFQLPLKHYRGISIRIDLDCTNNPLMEYAERCECSFGEAFQHLCGGMSHIVLRSSNEIKKFFHDLYDVDIDQCLSYLRVKMPELFYWMKYTKTNCSYYERSLVPCTQVEIVKLVSDYISKNLNEKITLKQLTLMFGVSDTYLQNAFRNVYGMPVIRFIRVQKMQCATQMLIHTTYTIEEIAEQFGYESDSKFSSAFKKIIGNTPGEYRKEHTKIKII